MSPLGGRDGRMAKPRKIKTRFRVATLDGYTRSCKPSEPSAEQTGGPLEAVGCARNAVRAPTAVGINEPVTVPFRGEVFLQEPPVFGQGRSRRHIGEDDRTAVPSRWGARGCEAYQRIKQ